MADCVNCNISFDYGKKFCGQCGSPLIETKDIFNEAVNLFNIGQLESALQKIIEIPSFSFFYEKSILLKAKVYAKQGKSKELSELLAQEQSWLKIDFEEKKELRKFFIEQIKSENTSRNYNMSLKLLDSMSVAELKEEGIKLLKAETFYLYATELYKEGKIENAEKFSLQASELGNKNGTELYINIRNTNVMVMIKEGRIEVARKILDENLRLLPNSVSSLELKDKIEKIESASKRKKKNILYGIALVLILMALGYGINYFILTGEIELKIKLSNTSLYSIEHLVVEIEGTEIERSNFKQNIDGTYSVNLSTSTGEKKITVKQKYFFPETVKVNISNSKNQFLEILLRQKLAKIKIDSEPRGSKIYLDGVYRGVTPLELNSIYSGIYGLQINSPDYYGHQENLILDDTILVINRKLKSRVLFFDSFNESSKGWENYSAPGHIKSIQNGALSLVNTTSDKNFNIAYTEKEFTNFELVASMSVTNYQKGKAFGGIQFGARFGEVWGRSYFIELAEGYFLRFGKNNGEGNNPGNPSHFTGGYNNWIKISDFNMSNFRLRLINNNGQVKIYLNNKLEFSTNIAANSGVVAVWCSANSTVKLNEIKILDYDINQIE